MERPRKETSERPGVCASARKLGARGEGDPREAKVSTGLGQAHRPGAQGGLRKRRPWWNEAPTSRIESARAGNSPPKVVRAADLSRPRLAQPLKKCPSPNVCLPLFGRKDASCAETSSARGSSAV